MPRHIRRFAGITAFLSILCVASIAAHAADIDILVGAKGSAAYDTAKARANKTTIFAAKSVTKAFKTAGQQIMACGDCTVNIKIAAGDYFGKAKTGHWLFPDVVAPGVRLRIVGGYDDSFTSRAPFQNQSRLITAQDRSRPVIQFAGRKHALKELYLSGLTFDVAPGNKYDSRNNSLLKGTSSLYPILAFGYLTTDRLVVAENIFLNGAHTVAQPLIRAMSNDAEILVRNNLIMNTVMAWRVNSPSGKLMIKRYGFENNSFILNWPYNPDPGTSNPGTLEIGNKYAAKLVDITKNLFAYNAGGAIHAQWDDVKGPPVAITENLFWGNGALFAVLDPDMAAVVGKFNGSARYLPLSADDAEDFEWDVEDNAAFDPKLHVQVKPFLAAGSKKAVLAAGAKAEPDAPPIASKDTTPADPAMAELAALLGEDAVLMAGVTADEPTPVIEEAVEEDPYASDDYADLGFGEGGNTKIQNYATRLFIDGIPPFPTNPDATPYGARADLVEQF
ncbi:MAG: hypothetical protein JKY27_10345 [Magnetovibrio sp.]|nr:hypothetical protein [Magnetovibrio sp.]